MWIDSHCHMDSYCYVKILKKLLVHAITEGVERIIIPSVSKENFDKVIKIAGKY